MGEEWEGCACALGWSDFVLCGFSKLGTLLPIRYIFRSSLPKHR